MNYKKKYTPSSPGSYCSHTHPYGAVSSSPSCMGRREEEEEVALDHRDAGPCVRDRHTREEHNQQTENFDQPDHLQRNSVNWDRFANDFDVVKKLGEGGFGRVVEGRHKLDGYSYAIKVIPVEDPGDDPSVQEACTLAKLNHPRVVRYHTAWLQDGLQPISPSVGSSSSGVISDFEDEDDEEDDSNSTFKDRSDDDDGNGRRPRQTLYLQMELCGEPLDKWLDQRNRNAEPVDENMCMMIFTELIEALTYIHKNHFIHRDVKPANIFFTLEGQPHHIKLGDFGLAKESVQPPTPCPSDASILTPVLAQRNTSRVGTTLYMAPEVDTGSNYGEKVDIYSAGITLLELFSPFTTTHQRFKEIQNLREERRLDPELRRKWPDIANLILQLTDPEPNNRPSSKKLLTSPLFGHQAPPPSPAKGAFTHVRSFTQKLPECHSGSLRGQ